MASKAAAKPKAKPAPKEKKERRLGVTVKDVSAEAFIREYAAHLKKAGKLRLPKWVDYAKTAVSKELPPLDPNWLYVRAGMSSRPPSVLACARSRFRSLYCPQALPALGHRSWHFQENLWLP